MSDKKNKTHTTPTLKDVAKHAGVSLATASYVLNGKGAISKKVTDEVLEIVKKLGYKPNKAARFMKTGNSATIGLLLPDFRYSLFSDLASEIEKVCARKEYSVFFANSYADGAIEKQRTQSFSQWGCEALIWFPGSQEDTIASSALSMPVIVIDRDLHDYDVVTPDHYDGGVQQAAHLLSLGHRNIGIISGPTHVDNMQLRINGTKDEIKGSDASLEWICETDFSDSLSSEAKQCLHKQDVTAIIAGNDAIALNIVRYVATLGIRVPEDLSVIGFDDTSWCQIMTPQLTSIRMPLAEMAEEAFNMMLRRKENAAASRKKSVVGVELSIRQSTARCKVN